MAKALADFRLVKPQLLLDLVRRDLEGLEARIARLTDVLAVLLEAPPGERARAYLQRVSSCYVSGLEPETVIMCRAVLDAAFDDRVPEALVWSHVTRKYEGQVPVLADRITAAQRSGIISRQLAADARSVKDAANLAIHGIPVSTMRPLDALRATASILGAITT